MQRRINGPASHVVCVPHAPMLKLQERGHNAAFWDAYDARVAAFRRFDPELVIVFGNDHLAALYLRLMPTFVVGIKAEAIEDWGGMGGPLDVPLDLAQQLAIALAVAEFDVATSYAMRLDHGFSAVLERFLEGRLDARPVIPIFINAHFTPRPSLARCRRFGEAIGRWAASLGKRVAFIGSGGLSHDVSMVFPQYDTAPDEATREFLVHGKDESSLQQWLAEVRQIMAEQSVHLVNGGPSFVKENPEWDARFMQCLSGDLRDFDTWTDEAILADGGSGGGEIRLWIAAAAAGSAAGAGPMVIDFFPTNTRFGFGVGIAHAETTLDDGSAAAPTAAASSRTKSSNGRR